MLTPDLVRDSFVGQLVYYGSGRHIFRYDEEKPDFVLLEEYAQLLHGQTLPKTPVPDTPRLTATPGRPRKHSVSSVMERTGGADLAFIRSRQSTFDNRAGTFETCTLCH